MTSIKKKYELDTFQLEACENIDNGFNILVSAPTGSGKTAIAEYAIEFTKKKNSLLQIIYTCPIKSLCNEKYRDMVISHTSENTNYTIGLMTGDIIINPDRDIIIMTTEVLYNLITNKEKEFNPGCVIFDEAHYINDDGRGHIWEKCIIYSLEKYDCLLVLLSATIGNIDTLMDWLNNINENKKFKKIIKIQRPVPLREYLIDNTKIRNLKKKVKINENETEEKLIITDDPAEELYELLELNDINYTKVKKYWSKLEEFNYSIEFELQTLCNQIASNPNLGVPAIIFVLSKNKCINFAEMCTSTYVDFQEQNKILHFYDENLKEFEANSQYIDLRKIISKGIAYHHSGLIPKIREVVEFLIKNKLIKIVFATETFAVGLNFPVKTVVLTSLNKPSENGFRNLYVSEYKQMAGRAGRRFIDQYGNVILWLYNDRPKHKFPYPSWNEINSIIAGPVNNVTSKFVIEPNYLLKNLDDYKNITLKTFKYYKSDKNIYEFVMPEKYSKLFESDKKSIEFSNYGFNFINKNYNKLLAKFNKEEQNEYQKLLIQFKTGSNKTEYQIYLENEDYLIKYLNSNDFIVKENDNWILTEKGEIASYFNEINPILFIENLNRILTEKESILPILSMFIDDGVENKNDEHIFKFNDYPDIIYFDDIVNIKYKNFINILPKWNFFPQNYLIFKTWIENKNITLDQITYLYEIDMGLMVKILIKMYQITDELLTKLVKINRTDLTEFISLQKELIIRYPIKLESLYINN